MGLFKSFKPDLVLCDVNMPDMSGFEVLKEFQSLDPSVPIIQMSSTVASEHFLKIAKTMGAYEVLDKASDNETVLLIVKSALEN